MRLTLTPHPVPPNIQGWGRADLALGENDLALEWLEKAFDERVADLIYLKADPAFDPLRSSPRFKHLLARVNFPE